MSQIRAFKVRALEVDPKCIILLFLFCDYHLVSEIDARPGMQQLRPAVPRRPSISIHRRPRKLSEVCLWYQVCQEEEADRCHYDDQCPHRPGESLHGSSLIL